MSLLKGKQDGLIIEYQLPIGFEDQLSILDKYINCIENGKIVISKVWELIKDNVIIYEDLGNGKEKAIWSKGSQVEETPFMLGYTTTTCQFFSSKLQVFFRERKVQL